MVLMAPVAAPSAGKSLFEEEPDQVLRVARRCNAPLSLRLPGECGVCICGRAGSPSPAGAAAGSRQAQEKSPGLLKNLVQLRVFGRG